MPRPRKNPEIEDAVETEEAPAAVVEVNEAPAPHPRAGRVTLISSKTEPHHYDFCGVPSYRDEVYPRRLLWDAPAEAWEAMRSHWLAQSGAIRELKDTD